MLQSSETQLETQQQRQGERELESPQILHFLSCKNLFVSRVKKKMLLRWQCRIFNKTVLNKAKKKKINMFQDHLTILLYIQMDNNTLQPSLVFYRHIYHFHSIQNYIDHDNYTMIQLIYDLDRFHPIHILHYIHADNTKLQPNLFAMHDIVHYNISYFLNIAHHIHMILHLIDYLNRNQMDKAVLLYIHEDNMVHSPNLSVTLYIDLYNMSYLLNIDLNIHMTHALLYYLHNFPLDNLFLLYKHLGSNKLQTNLFVIHDILHYNISYFLNIAHHIHMILHLID